MTGAGVSVVPLPANRSPAVGGTNPSTFKKIAKIAIMVALGGLCWWIANNFEVASPDGFDPLRYEYYAREGLPNAFSDSSSYRMVIVLESIYRYLPFYVGYLALIILLCSIIRLSDRTNLVSLAIFSPISFYYLSQTGKDGIAILSLVAAGLLARHPRHWATLLSGTIVIGLGIFVRPAIGLLLPIAVIQFRYGTFWALLVCPIMLYAFSQVADTYLILSTLEGLTGDEGAGRFAQLLRQYTFGYDIYSVGAKLVLLLFSVFFQPALAFAKYFYGSSSFVLFEGICYLLFGYILIRRRLTLKFFVSSIPYVIMVGASSPFYHFRYLAVAYPAIMYFCIYTSGMGWSSATPRGKWRVDAPVWRSVTQ